MANARSRSSKTSGCDTARRSWSPWRRSCSWFASAWRSTRRRSTLTPDQIKKAAEAAETNINRRIEPEEILEKLEDEGIVRPQLRQGRSRSSRRSLLVADDLSSAPATGSRPSRAPA